MPSEARGPLRVKLRANSKGTALARRSRILVKPLRSLRVGAPLIFAA